MLASTASRFKRVLVAVSATALTLGALTACSQPALSASSSADTAPATTSVAAETPSVESVVQSSLTSQINELKNVDETRLRAIMGNDAFDELAGLGIDPIALFHGFFDRLTCTTNAVQVSGNTAIVSLSTTNVDAKTIMESWMNEMTTFISTSEAGELYASGGETAVMQKAFSMLTDKLAASDAPMVSTDATIAMTRDDTGTWSVDDENQMVAALMGGVSMSDIDSIAGDAA